MNIVRTLFTAAILSAHIAGVINAGDTVLLSAAKSPGRVTQVLAKLNVGGKLLIDTFDEATQKPTLMKVPMEVTATLTYEERRLPVVKNQPARSLRYYTNANAEIKIEKGVTRPTLPKNRRLIVVTATKGHAQFHSPAGPISRETLDLTDIVGNSLVLGRLLPGKEVAEGDTWDVPEAAVSTLLRFEKTTHCEVQCILAEFNKSYAKVEFAGMLEGSIDGSPTTMELKGAYLFHRKDKLITRFNLAINEKRTSGEATPGLDVVAKLVLTTKLLTASNHLTDKTGAQLPPFEKTPADILEYGSAKLGYHLTHDQHWFVTKEETNRISFCRVEEGEFLASLNISQIQSVREKEAALEEFKNNVQAILARENGKITTTDSWTNIHGHKCYVVYATGEVNGAPIAWRYFLVVPKIGKGVTISVTTAPELVQQLGAADRDFADSIKLFVNKSEGVKKTRVLKHARQGSRSSKLK